MAALDREISARHAAEHERREFERKANRFVELWNKLIPEYNSQRTFNVKSARALAKAFRELEATGWPK